ncbi:MAG: hypothetical protein ABFD92_09580 [Planctomycetaceae bacterium]|nr:hypothetical protein [Planctomycetaceae bacterium]
MLPQFAELSTLWDKVSSQCKSNPSLFSSHLRDLAFDDVDDAVTSVVIWGNRITESKTTSVRVKIARALLASSMANLLSNLRNIVAGRYDVLPTFINNLNQAFLSLYPLTLVGAKNGKEVALGLSGDLAEAISMVQRSNDLLEENTARLSGAEQILEKTEAVSEAVEVLKKKIESTSEQIEKQSDEIEEIAKAVSGESESAAANSRVVRAFADDVAALQSHLGETQTKLDQLVKQAEVDQKRIDHLLPQATSAGLATAFAQRGAKLNHSIRGWLIGFWASIILLAGSIIFAFIYFPVDTEAHIWVGFLRKLPFAAPWVWLAWFCARNYGHTIRLQEVYAFKEAASYAFEGYKKQMYEIGASSESGQPNALLAELAARVLVILSKEPLAVFDRQSADETPFHSLAERFFGGKVGAVKED